jgi:hypothetical protein
MSLHHSNQDVWFDDAAMRAIGTAFDQACGALGNFGTGVIVREIMAKRIVEVAKNGERDPGRLYRQALDALGIDEQSATQLAA